MDTFHLWMLLLLTTGFVVGEKQIKLEDIERDNLDSVRQLKQKQTAYAQQQQPQAIAQPQQVAYSAQTQPQQVAYAQAQPQQVAYAQTQQQQQPSAYPNHFPNLQFSPQFIQQLQQAYLQHAVRQLQARGQGQGQGQGQVQGQGQGQVVPVPAQQQQYIQLQQQQLQKQQQQQTQPGPAYYILPSQPVQYYSNQPVQYLATNHLDNNQRHQATQVVHVVQPPQHLTRQAHFYQPQQQSSYATIPYSVPVKQVQLTSVQKIPTGTKSSVEEGGYSPTAAAAVHRQALQHPKHGISYFNYRSGPGAF